MRPGCNRSPPDQSSWRGVSRVSPDSQGQSRKNASGPADRRFPSGPDGLLPATSAHRDSSADQAAPVGGDQAAESGPGATGGPGPLLCVIREQHPQDRAAVGHMAHSSCLRIAMRMCSGGPNDVQSRTAMPRCWRAVRISGALPTLASMKLAAESLVGMPSVASASHRRVFMGVRPRFRAW